MKRKEQILQEIAKLMYEKGYEKTSMREISRSSNISKPGLYYHFENKQEILFSIINDFLEKNILELKNDLKKCETPEERLFCIINSHIQAFVRQPAQTKVVIYEIHSLSTEYSKKLKPKQRELTNIIKKELSTIMSETGVEFDINVMTFCLLGILAWIIQWYKPKGKVKPDKLAADICRFFSNGLGLEVSK